MLLLNNANDAGVHLLSWSSLIFRAGNIQGDLSIQGKIYKLELRPEYQLHF